MSRPAPIDPGTYRRPGRASIPAPIARTPIAYDSRFPVVAAWSLEFVAKYVVAFFQMPGNQVWCIGSRAWDFPTISECVRDASEFPWRADRHIVPPDPDNVYRTAFRRLELSAIAAPRLRPASTVTVTRELFGVLSVDQEDKRNAELVAALQAYRLEPMKFQTDEFTPSVAHDPAVYYTRAVEVFAAWRESGGTITRRRRPNRDRMRRHVI